MNLDEYERLKRQSEAARRDADKAAGAVEQIKARLKREFNVDSKEDAIKLGKRLEKEEARLSEEVDGEIAKLKAKWPDACST